MTESSHPRRVVHALRLQTPGADSTKATRQQWGVQRRNRKGVTTTRRGVSASTGPYTCLLTWPAWGETRWAIKQKQSLTTWGVQSSQGDRLCKGVGRGGVDRMTTEYKQSFHCITSYNVIRIILKH